ncbi:MAG: ABC transporter substrate-binding protein [Anaerolineae bacterium]|nr:ABC transporter substrate-binding protein [Caldilineales bacterium]MCX7853515.1 ABC transporter substrate-binding protein [Caldilineales bacterium]MDW8270182.1 ABC transporter substrate-binding protein [Anaerolineae bacterium]
MNRLAFLGLLLIALTLAGCAPPPAGTPPPPAATPTPTPVKLGLGYIPSVQFAPFYVALEKGYFAREGIAVELEHGFETDFLKLLGTNERQFIVASGEQVIIGRSQGLPVTYVTAWYRRFPVVLFAPADAGIAGPQDLAGKRVGIPGLFGASYVAWKALVYAAGVPEDQVTLESIGFTQAAAVNEGLVDAALDYTVNGPVQLRLAGKEVVEIAVDDYLAIPSNGLVTNETTIANQPQLVERMVRVMLSGIRYTLDHPDEAFAISLKFVPEAAQQEAVNRAIFDASLALWQPGAGERLGFTDPAIWAPTAEFMLKAGLVDRPVATDGIWTNRFVEAANVP